MVVWMSSRRSDRKVTNCWLLSANCLLTRWLISDVPINRITRYIFSKKEEKVWRWWPCISPKFSSEYLAILFCIWKAWSSNFGLTIEYPDCLLVVFLSSSIRILGYCFRLGHGCFHVFLKSFFINHSSFWRLGLSVVLWATGSIVILSSTSTRS